MMETDFRVLCDFVMDLKRDACECGRFPETRRAPFWFDVREQCQRKEGWRPFRCIAYNKTVRRISALERMMHFVVETNKAAAHARPEEK